MKNNLFIAIMVAVAMSWEGCTLEDVNTLGDACPGVQLVKLDEHQCSASDNSDAVCSGFIQAGVFDSQQCPVNYQCLEEEEERYCECPEGCGTTCCSSRYECRKQDGEAKCVLKQDEQCLSDEECLERDESTPYCDEGVCIECLDSSQCKNGQCKNRHCIECSKNADCKENSKGHVCVASKCVECDTESYSPFCATDNSQTICENGVIRQNQCDADSPLCVDGKCHECKQSEDCPQNRSHCLSYQCVECENDADCPEDSQGCNSKHQCIECLNDDDCTSKYGGDKPFCSSDGLCVECTNSEHCQDNNICNLENNTCVQCVKDADCKGLSAKAVCENSNCVLKCLDNSECPDSLFCFNEQCVSAPTDNMTCFSDAQCADDTIGRVCDVPNQKCVKCLKNEDCAAYGGGSCDLNYKSCVQCMKDEDCSDGKKCDLNLKSCVECRGDSDCSDGKVCRNQVCHSCDTSKTTCVDEKRIRSCVNYEYVEQDCYDAKPYCHNDVCVECLDGATDCSNGHDYRCKNNEWTYTQCNGICEGNLCVPYQYVRIEDLSGGGDEDSGSDIDAVEIWRGNKSVGYAESVVGQSKNFANINQSIGEHDAVVDDDKCNYYKCGTEEKLFTSLGGKNNYIVYKMTSTIQNGDEIRVYEVGGCYLFNLSRTDCTTKTSYRAGKDSFKVSILTSPTNNEKDVGTTEGKGPIIKFPVTL